MEQFEKSMVRHSSRIYLSQSSLKANFSFLRKKFGDDVRISSVVKANAYGHGIATFVPMAEKCGINHFAVASAHEAEEALNACKDDTQIMIMGILYEEDLYWAIENDIEFYVFNFARMAKVLEEAKRVGKPARIHLEVETGANRTGMDGKELIKCLKVMNDHSDEFIFEGLCSHLGGAESFSNDFKIRKQLKRFKEMMRMCARRGIIPKYHHIASSGGALAYPDSRFDMVRIGVSQYGFWPAPDVYYQHLAQTGKSLENGLRRIFTWKTDIMDIRKVDKGEFIGYGTSYQAPRDMTIAVLPLGYSNGYPRGQSNRGHVLIHGKKAPVTGLINMNLFMVDITHIPAARVGDEVVLVGRQKNGNINVTSFTNSTQLLNQEMMSRLPAAIPRKAIR